MPVGLIMALLPDLDTKSILDVVEENFAKVSLVGTYPGYCLARTTLL